MAEELRFIPRELAPTFFSGSATLWGLIEAGSPAPAEGEPLERLALDEYLIERKEATYLVLVKGSSMQHAGILPGDLLLVERTDSPQPGIVVVEVRGQWTLRFLVRVGDTLMLENIAGVRVPLERFPLIACVRSVIHKY
jgi:SOS-response transcriptional repressor LexA